ncbi:MAG TPA: outer membrane beta-barrel protein [Flavipsychrobacter sp.]|nr:outer membrane beta-barrel protein [Flavipsychrobacter sp.]
MLICLLPPVWAGAQHDGRSSVNLGIKVGANFNRVDGSYWDNGYKANLMAGAYLTINGARAGICIEPLFTQSTFVTGKGFNDLYSDFYNTAKDTITKGTFRVNYYNVPVLLNLKLFSRVWLQVGPQFTGTLSVKDNENLMRDAKAFFRTSMVSGVAGLWINLPAHLTVSGRYVMGFNNINGNADYAEQTHNVKDTWKQRMLQIGIGYTIF